MATYLFVPVLKAVFWDGDNFSEVLELCENSGRSLVDNGDGTITSGGGYMPEIVISQNQWVTEEGVVLSNNYREFDEVS